MKREKERKAQTPSLYVGMCRFSITCLRRIRAQSPHLLRTSRFLRCGEMPAIISARHAKNEPSYTPTARLARISLEPGTFTGSSSRGAAQAGSLAGAYGSLRVFAQKRSRARDAHS